LGLEESADLISFGANWFTDHSDPPLTIYSFTVEYLSLMKAAN